jgi:hypothetical protein
MKTVYLFGAMQIFAPYLTESGKKVYRQAADQYLRKSSGKTTGKK